MFGRGRITMQNVVHIARARTQHTAECAETKCLFASDLTCEQVSTW